MQKAAFTMGFNQTSLFRIKRRRNILYFYCCWWWSSCGHELILFISIQVFFGFSSFRCVIQPPTYHIYRMGANRLQQFRELEVCKWASVYWLLLFPVLDLVINQSNRCCILCYNAWIIFPLFIFIAKQVSQFIVNLHKIIYWTCNSD